MADDNTSAACSPNHVVGDEKTMTPTREDIEALIRAFESDGDFFNGEHALAACRMALRAAEAEKDAEALCEIAVAAARQSIADWCRAQIVPHHQAGGIAVESQNNAYERVIGMLESVHES